MNLVKIHLEKHETDTTDQSRGIIGLSMDSEQQNTNSPFSPEIDRAFDILARANTELLKQVRELTADQKKQWDAISSISRTNASLVDLVTSLYQHKLSMDESMSPQEKAWHGNHGLRYVAAHLGENWKKTRGPFWKIILDILPEVSTACEFGCNVGANLRALKHHRPELILHGFDINQIAVDLVNQSGVASAERASITLLPNDKLFDLVYSRDVLIHIRPDNLQAVFANMAALSKRYVLINEIYSSEPTELDSYSNSVGDKNVGERYQFWRDFAGDFAKQHLDFKAISSGVGGKIGALPKKGDLHWTLFERS